MAKALSVEVGAVYRANVGGKKVDVRVEREIWKGDTHTGWGGINLATNRPTTIKAGTKMTRVDPPEPPEPPEPVAPEAAVSPKGGKTKAPEKAPAGVPAATGAGGANVRPSEASRKPGKRSGAGGNKPVQPREKKQRPAESDKPKRRGALDLAAELLSQSPAPMTTAAMVAVMLERKLWFTNGKTPAATLYAAIIREISAKGKDSRFVKTARGQFAAAKK